MLPLDDAGRRRQGEHARSTVGSNGHWPAAEHERILERIEQNLQRCNQDGGCRTRGRVAMLGIVVARGGRFFVAMR